MSNAMGIVHAMVNSPQGDASSAFTTISASTASRMSIMNCAASIASAPAVQSEHAGSEEPGVEPIADGIGAHGRREQPVGVDRLPPGEGNHPEGRGAQGGNPAPQEQRGEPVHGA